MYFLNIWKKIHFLAGVVLIPPPRLKGTWKSAQMQRAREPGNQGASHTGQKVFGRCEILIGAQVPCLSASVEIRLKIKSWMNDTTIISLGSSTKKYPTTYIISSILAYCIWRLRDLGCETEQSHWAQLYTFMLCCLCDEDFVATNSQRSQAILHMFQSFVSWDYQSQ